ncbi:MAG: DinB family protein [Marinobacterium sp.]|nr:DinB family protein [Marinobacterium sp.]
MSEVQSLRLMAQYNQWMNETLYTAASGLTAEQLSDNQGAFFGSILGTLNHLMVGDIIWLQRFADHPADFAALANLHHIPKPSALNATLFDDIEELQMQRELLDQLIIDWCDELQPEHLSHPLTYHNTQGIASTRPFGLLVTHLFNHQTHHRGQVTTLLSQQGIDIAITDLLALIPEINTDGEKR